MKESSLKERTAKGLFWGGLGSGVQQFMSLLFGVILARILTQEDYGMVGVLAVFSAMATSIQEGGFTAALVNKRKVRHEDYNAVFWFSSLSGLLMYLILFACAPLIADFFHEPALTAVARVLFLGFLLGSLGVSHNALLLKRMKMRERAVIDVISLVISNAIGVTLVLNGFAYWGLVIQTVIFALITLLLRWYYSTFRPTFTFDFRPLKEMFPFSIKILLTGFFVAINTHVITLFLGRLFTKHEVGDYTQGQKWSTIGSSIVNNILQHVSHPVLVEAGDDMARQKNVFRKMLRFAAFISFPTMLGLALVSEELIVLLITEKWLTSVPILQLLSVWGAFIPITTLYRQLTFVHSKSEVYMWSTIATGILQVALLFLLHQQGIHIMVLSFVCINLLWLFVWQYYAHKLIHLRFWEVIKDLAPYLLIALFVLGIAYLATLSVTNLFLSLILKIVISAVLYIFIMRYSNSVIYRESMHYFKNMRKK